MGFANAYLQNQGTIAVSTAAKVLINGNVIGVVQSLDPSQDRNTTPVRGIGIGDRIIERVWGLTDYKLTCTKFALFQASVFSIFSATADRPASDGFRMLAQLRTPVDIQEILMLPVADPNSDALTIRTTNYRGCYMTSFSAPRSIGGDIIITETVNFDCTYIDNNEGDPFDYPTGVSLSQ
jgi:hypothetical protein